MYSDRQVCLNSVDPDETAESSVSAVSTLFSSNPAFLGTTSRIKLYMFKF